VRACKCKYVALSTAPEAAEEARVVLDEMQHASRLATHAVAVHEQVPALEDKLEEPLVRSRSLHDVVLVGIDARDGALRPRERSLLRLRWLGHAETMQGRVA
jgi:hypothetical protein